VQSLIGSRKSEFNRKMMIEFSATFAHEIGHATGVRHPNPDHSDFDDPELRNCTIRYYDPDEFIPQMYVGWEEFETDIFAFAARGYNPSKIT